MEIRKKEDSYSNIVILLVPRHLPKFLSRKLGREILGNNFLNENLVPLLCEGGPPWPDSVGQTSKDMLENGTAEMIQSRGLTCREFGISLKECFGLFREECEEEEGEEAGKKMALSEKYK